MGLIFFVISILLFFFKGFSILMLLLWLFSLVYLGIFFYRKNDLGKILKKFHRRDIYVLIILAAIFIPIYCFDLYNKPFQITPDEIVVTVGAQKIAAQPMNPFGFNTYENAYVPGLIYYIFAKLALLFGSIDIWNLRLVHGIFGVITVLASFLFFRSTTEDVSQIDSQIISFCASALFGFSHSFLAISRMAIRDNTVVLIFFVSFIFLFTALRNRSAFLSLAGGAIAGLGYYTYYPARIIIFLWLVYLLGLYLAHHKEMKFFLGRHLLTGLLGFILVIAPITIASLQNVKQVLNYPQGQFLVTQAGILRQQRRTYTDNKLEAFKANIISGVSMFNNKVMDKGWIYPNSGHGFLDPISGVLLWVGVIFSLIKRKSQMNTFFLIGFVSLWTVFTFIINDNPTYSRSLISLPFVIYFLACGIRRIAGMLRESLGNTISIAAFIILIVANIMIYQDFINIHKGKGDHRLGATAHYLHEHKESPQSYYVLTDDKHAFFNSRKALWADWFKSLTSPAQQVKIWSPAEYIANRHQVQAPATILTRADLWKELNVNEENSMITSISARGDLIAIQINYEH